MKARDRPPLRTGLAVAAAIPLAAASAGGGWAGYLHLTGNIHEVVAGEVYRSGQLDATDLGALLRDKGIRTVINLRGANPGSAWYRDEVRVTAAAGVNYVSLPMSAVREPDDALLASLISALAAAPKPLLIHCRSGADRTGLAAALYQLLVQRLPAGEADGQLSFRYGHFPWLTSRTGAMDRAFWRVAASVGGGLPPPALDRLND
jgi:uncharacterized protein (TIGR01244 family)